VKLLILLNIFIGLLGRGIGPTQYLFTYTGQHNLEEHRHTSMPQVGMEPPIPHKLIPRTCCCLYQTDIR